MPSIPTNRPPALRFNPISIFHCLWFCFPFRVRHADTRHRHHRTACRFVVCRFQQRISHSTDTTNRNGIERSVDKMWKENEAKHNKATTTTKKEKTGKIHLSRAVAMCRRNAIFHSFVIGSSAGLRTRVSARAPFFSSLLFILVHCEASTAECAVRQMDL